MADKTMRAFRLAEGAREAKLVDIPVPEIYANEVLVKVVSAGLATGVLKIAAAGRTGQTPMTLGHQTAGIVEKIGPGVEKIKIGDRVRVHPTLACGTCRLCTTDRDHMCPEGAMIGFQGFGKGRMPLYEKYHDGGVADFIRVPATLIDILPDNVGFDIGAKVQDLANAVRVLKTAELEAGSTVAITSSTGAMGCACVKMASLFGIKKLILVGRSTERLEAVRKLASVSCEIVCTPVEQKGPPLPALIRRYVPEGVDAIIDFSASGTDIYSIFGALAVNGIFVHMGASMETLPLPLIAMMVNCWRIVGTRNNSRADTSLVLQWLREGTLNVDELITHRFKLDAIDKAVKQINDRQEQMWMMVINP